MTLGLSPPLVRKASNNDSYLLLRGAGCSSRTSRCRFTAFALHCLSPAAGRPDGRRYDGPPVRYTCRSLFHIVGYRVLLLPLVCPSCLRICLVVVDFFFHQRLERTSVLRFVRCISAGTGDMSDDDEETGRGGRRGERQGVRIDTSSSSPAV